MFRRSILIFAIALVGGCGGSGGGSSSSGICSPTLYVPNYAGASNLTLRRWNHLPIKVYFQTSTQIGGTTIEDLVRDGFNKWETALSRDLWTEVTSASGADLTVKVQASSPQTTLATTTVYFSGGSSTLTSAEMTIYTWPSIPQNNYDPTGCHEMGHALGIGGHSPNSLDIMYYTGNASGELTTSDLNTLRTAYCDFAGFAHATAEPTGPIMSETEVFPAKK